MQIGNRQFTPPWWGVVLYLLIMLTMVKLGLWQLGRAALKVEMREAATTAAAQPASTLISIADFAKAAKHYERVQLVGRYDQDHQFLWDNRTHRGVAGYEVITPFETLEGQWILVNRGWVEPGATRQHLPEVGLPEQVSGSPVTLEGFLSQPSQGFASGPVLTDSTTWPKVLQYFDYDALQATLGVSLKPVILQGQALDVDGKKRHTLVARPEWLIANWQPAASGPFKHYSYAFQWFAMALAMSVIFLLVNMRKSNASASP